MKAFFFVLSFLVVPFLSCQKKNETHRINGNKIPVTKDSTSVKKTILPPFRPGDLIFQSSVSGQSEAIQIATRSKYSHVGILLEKNGELQVFEAVQPVKFTPLEEWIERGRDKEYVVKRLQKADSALTEATLMKMTTFAGKAEGKNYDLAFSWTNDQFYCSELVYKIFKEAGIELCNLRKLKEFDLKHPIVKIKLNERYGDNIPFDEPVVSPADLFHSSSLLTLSPDFIRYGGQEF